MLPESRDANGLRSPFSLRALNQTRLKREILPDMRINEGGSLNLIREVRPTSTEYRGTTIIVSVSVGFRMSYMYTQACHNVCVYIYIYIYVCVLYCTFIVIVNGRCRLIEFRRYRRDREEIGELQAPQVARLSETPSRSVANSVYRHARSAPKPPPRSSR
jgi:hypothetical protein